MPFIKHVKKRVFFRTYTTLRQDFPKHHGNKYSPPNAFITLPSTLEPRASQHEHTVGASQTSQGKPDERIPAATLQGRHIAVKDNICTIDSPTTCASNILQDFRSPFDATVVERLKELGANVAGKTNMDEFGMGSHSTHSHTGWVANRGPDGNFNRSAGGSSGGSAVAVAEGDCRA
jgi:aspartyl-tRNA(Asn)/glutamyl-tRNA(Gln) amidotransferase subunit A